MTEINITLPHGGTYLARLTIKRDGAPADLTGKVVTVLFKRDALEEDADAFLSLTSAAGLTFPDLLAGTVDIEVTPAQSGAASPARVYTWACQILESATGRIFTACGGSAQFSPDAVLATS